MVMVVPIDPDIYEAEHIAEEDRQQWQQVFRPLPMRYMQLQDHYGDDDGDNPIAKCFEPSFIHVMKFPAWTFYQDVDEFNHCRRIWRTISTGGPLYFRRPSFDG
jgi:hypothetical protein